MACPVDLPSEFDRRLGTRKAIFRPYPQAIPNVFGISKAEGTGALQGLLPGRRERAGLRGAHRGRQVQGGLRTGAASAARSRPRAAASASIPARTQCNRAEDATSRSPVRDLKRFAADYVTPTATRSRRPSPRPSRSRTRRWPSSAAVRPASPRPTTWPSMATP